MKVLFNNLFEIATFSATNESLNYPVGNLIHPFLQKRFQSSSSSSVITALFTADQSFDCFFYGFHNITSLTVVFKDSGDSTLLTIPITSTDDIGVESFSLLTTVRSVEITINGPEPVYLGGIGGGTGYIMPNPLAAYDPGSVDNSVPVESPAGQTLQNYVKPLRSIEFGFRDQDIPVRNEIENLYRNVGVGKNLYFDLFEEDREKEPPLYGKIISPLRFPYVPRRHNFTLSLQESR